jgi:hypothetical protein
MRNIAQSSPRSGKHLTSVNSMGTPMQRMPSPSGSQARLQPAAVNQASSLFPPIGGKAAPMTPSSYQEKVTMMDDLMEQQRVLQQNIDNMVKIQRE